MLFLMILIMYLKQQGNALLPENYATLSNAEKVDVLANLKADLNEEMFSDITKDTIESVKVIKEIHAVNGEAGCHRYIISNCTSAVDVIEVYALFRICGWNEDRLPIDIVPLFETIDDLSRCYGNHGTIVPTSCLQKAFTKQG